MPSVNNRVRVPREKLLCAILDWNGTILDDTRAIFAATVRGMEDLGYSIPTFRRYRHTAAHDPVTHLRALGVSNPEHRRVVCARFFDEYARALDEYPPQVRRRFPELLKVLRDRGVPTAILSNHPIRLLQADVARFGVQVDHVVGREEDSFCKKARADQLLARLGFASRQVAVIGDGLADVQLAKDLDAQCIAVSWGITRPAKLRRLGVPVVSCPSQIVVS